MANLFEAAKKTFEMADTACSITELYQKLHDVEGGANPAAEVLGTALNGYHTIDGMSQLGKGMEDDNGVEEAHGIHDMLSGGTGLLGNFNPFVKAFSTGMSVGDLIAPHLMGDESGFTGQIDMPADGHFDDPSLAETFRGSPVGEMFQDFQDNPVGEVLDLVTDLSPLGLMKDGLENVFGDFLPSFDDIGGKRYNLADIAAGRAHVPQDEYNLADVAAGRVQTGTTEAAPREEEYSVTGPAPKSFNLADVAAGRVQLPE